jgi:hypothetical protein
MEVTKIAVNLPADEISGILQSEGALPSDIADALAAAFHEKWRQNAKRVYICSPYDLINGKRQMLAARAYAKDAEYSFGVLGISPTAYLTELFSYSTQRKQLEHVKSMLLQSCNGLYICGDEITPDMVHDIRLAFKCRLPVTVFNGDLYKSGANDFQPF